MHTYFFAIFYDDDKKQSEPWYNHLNKKSEA